MSSAAEALDLAQDRLRSALADIGARPGARVGGYYPRVPLREPILDELTVDGEQVLAVTRNRYGAEVLNTDRLLIADIDLPELEQPSSFGGRLRGWLRRSAPEPIPPGEPAPVVKRLAVLADWAASQPHLGVIAYRTASGLRVFATGIAEPTTSAEGVSILTEWGADPVYRELCRTHGTFRARLTPKPWRLPRLRAPRGQWPFADDRAEQRFQHWLATYEAASRDYAVCRRVASHGPAPSALEAQIIQRHDDRTGVSSQRPLA